MQILGKHIKKHVSHRELKDFKFTRISEREIPIENNSARDSNT